MKASGVSLATALVAGCNQNGGGDGGDGGTTTTESDGEEPIDETETEETGTAETGTAGTETAAPTESYALGGETSGWQGQEPESIAGETNPTLSFEAGETYEITWENLDGAEHELIIENEAGEELAATESASEEGETRSLTYEATGDAASYYCEYHPESMRGDVSVSGTETGTAATAETETETAETPSS